MMKIKTNIGDIKVGTNILDIEVPEKLRKRIKSGLGYFDDALGGRGFCPSAVTLFTGTPGAGKTTMMLELANSLTGHGSSVLFNTAEESLYQLKMTVERLKLRHGFSAGQETMVPQLLKNCDMLREKDPTKPFFLIVDSLQCLNDGKYGDHSTNSRTAQRSLQMITDYCKEHFCNAIIIGQVTKNGQMAGANVLKHMVDAMMSLDVERKDEDLMGCRILQTQKNRFGGAGHIFFLSLREAGFDEVSRISIT
jgi:DNA repair protein RadA/Sms|tara:strand:- start:6920 stop:7672 length:753 start_codon:yes stop_codon:yes gene_type:complete